MTDLFPVDRLTDAPEATPMALFHGFIESPALWRALPNSLWDGHDAVSLPLPGHVPMSGDALETMLAGDAFLDAYAETLERLRPGETWRLVGHSTGALVALALAERAPHLVRDVCAVAPLFAGRVCGRNLQGTLVKLPVVGPIGFRWLISRWLADPQWFTDGVRGVTAVTGADLSGLEQMRRDLAICNPDHLYRFGVWVGGQDMSGKLADIDRPIHAMICADDPVIIPTHQLELIATVPRASAILMGSGHLPMLERPQDFARAFTAWAQLPAPAVRAA